MHQVWNYASEGMQALLMIAMSKPMMLNVTITDGGDDDGDDCQSNMEVDKTDKQSSLGACSTS